MSEARDVVIVGGGIAGLSAAWHLRHRDVLLLEAGDRLGGRMRSDRRGDGWLNYGAHLFPAPGSIVDALAADCGLETVPVPGSMMGIAVGDRRLTTGPVESYPLRLPLSVRDGVAFARAGLKMQRAVARYLRIARERPAELLAYEDDRTYAEFLGDLPPAVREIFSCAAHRATAELDELSAGCGIGLFALVWGGKGSLIARNLVGGTGRLPEAMGERLGERARTNCRVTALRPQGERIAVEHEGGSVLARQVILAAPAPHAAPLAARIAPAAADALSRLTYGAFLCVAIELERPDRPVPWDAVYAMATPGRVFDMFTKQANGGSLMLFTGAHRAAELSQEGDETIVARFLEDLHSLFPAARGLTRDAVVHRWELGNVYARPGRSRLQAPLEGALGPHRNLHLAGDYFAELGNLETAARTGVQAAGHADAHLSRHSHDEVLNV